MTRASAARDVLARVAGEFHPAALASSLSIEDMALADLIAREVIGAGPGARRAAVHRLRVPAQKAAQLA
jgi:hypothetical protein